MYPYLKIFGFELPMYGLCMSLAITAALVISCIRAKKRGQDVEGLISIALFAIVCGLLGAKALYILVTYSPAEIIEGFRSNGLGFFANSGLVFYGALIGGVGGAFLGSAV